MKRLVNTTPNYIGKAINHAEQVVFDKEIAPGAYLISMINYNTYGSDPESCAGMIIIHADCQDQASSHLHLYSSDTKFYMHFNETESKRVLAFYNDVGDAVGFGEELIVELTRLF